MPDGDERIIFQLKQYRIKKLYIFILFLITLSIFFNNVYAITVYPGIEFEVENEIYTVYQVMDFSKIIISDTYIIFNSTGFYIDSTNDITITLTFINSNIYQASDGDLILQFYANANNGNVLFEISGFTPGSEYEVRRDGTVLSNPVANSSGFIIFSNDVWSSHLFSVYQSGMGSDVISPTISNIVLTSSNPKDTNPAFGWENITCTVIDNVEVEQVKVNIVYPNDSSINVSMNHLVGTNNYYYYTSLPTQGSYIYYIWARDTSANSDTSSNKIFKLPPNWDINSDGLCTVLDLALVSNYYNDVGDPGWIRADVDNGGKINVLDLILVSNHYDEIWS